MEGQLFDSLVRRFVAARSRRQALAALGGSALAVLGLRGAAAQEDVGVATCRLIGQQCMSREQCCGAQEDHNVGCTRLSRRCRDGAGTRGMRCCGRRGEFCNDHCDCCRRFACRANRCRRI